MTFLPFPGSSAASGAELDPTGKYRYRLWRRFGSGVTVVWVMLNPSTADASNDDPTLRRVRPFSIAAGFGRLEVVNLFALRATDPRELELADDPVGPENDAAIDAAVRNAGAVVVAWGYRDSRLVEARAAAVLSRLPSPVLCLGSSAGRPRHPLYVRASKALEEFRQ